MRTSIVIFNLLCFLCASLAYAEIAQNIKQSRAHYDKDGLFIVVAIIGDWDAALKEWGNPSIQGIPKIQTQAKFHKLDLMVPFIIYSTDSVDENGSAHITYDFKVIKPDGSIYFEQKELKVIKGIPPKGYGMFQQPSGLKIEEKDPLGGYKVLISVTDHNKSKTVKFPMGFSVIE